MSELSQADQYLIEQIRSRNSAGWSQLVARYQGRLLAFARGKINRREDAEDLVQETFIGFLQSLPRFRAELSLETFLFMILRRKIIDHFRGKNSRTCSLQDLGQSHTDESSRAMEIESDDLTASVYVSRDEQGAVVRALLAKALDEVVNEMQRNENLRDLQIIEMLFYANLRNKDVGKIAGIDEKHVALIKHRVLNSLRDAVTRQRGSAQLDESAGTDSMISAIWEDRRPTCPKRSTIGRFQLSTLESPWREYVDFHLNRLGCHFCQANLEDLRKQSESPAPDMQQRIMQSTIGFFRPQNA
ncbi:MAG TPA: sigma-70 family RNA polymerase sigma factor [Tepidisphaeraceae bacterium]|nr:sigma-70 family RNA polymerase sigma factor [Tepidisphaeraceae bacterium]